MPDDWRVPAVLAFIGVAAVVAGIERAYRYYRWVTYGEPMP